MPLLQRALIGALLGLVSLIAAVAAQAATDTGVYVEFRESDQPGAPVVDRWRLYGASYALVIGIDNYTGGWPRLSNAIKDAELVADELRKQGFEVELLTDVTGSQLRIALRRFFAFKGKDPQARLFVWFAGHGHTKSGEGYLVPADAPLPGSPEFNFAALHMGDIGSMVRIAESKHVLAVFDSCFAGTVFNSQRSRPPAAITAAVKRPVRQFLTSGDADQKVSDDGAFRTLFLRALKGEETADANRDGYLTGTELSFYLEDRVINLSQGAQTPRGGKLRDPKYDQGDFVFLLPRAPTVPLAETTAGSEATLPEDSAASEATGFDERSLELAFWQSISASRNSSVFREYLSRYPDGLFSGLAKIKLEELQRGEEPLRAEAATTTQATQAQQARLPPEPVAPPAIEDLDLAYVTVKSANVRAEPDVASRRIGRLEPDENILVTGRVIGMDWYRVAFKGQQAFVYGPLIKVVPPDEKAAPLHSQAEAEAYFDSNSREVLRDIFAYNEAHKVALFQGQVQTFALYRLKRVDILGLEGENVEARVTFTMNEPWNPAIMRQVFVFRWAGQSLKIARHKMPGETESKAPGKDEKSYSRIRVAIGRVAAEFGQEYNWNYDGTANFKNGKFSMSLYSQPQGIAHVSGQQQDDDIQLKIIFDRNSEWWKPREYIGRLSLDRGTFKGTLQTGIDGRITSARSGEFFFDLSLSLE